MKAHLVNLGVGVEVEDVGSHDVSSRVCEGKRMNERKERKKTQKKWRERKYMNSLRTEGGGASELHNRHPYEPNPRASLLAVK